MKKASARIHPHMVTVVSKELFNVIHILGGGGGVFFFFFPLEGA